MMKMRDRARPKFTMVAKSNEAMVEQIRERGVSMVNDKVMWETPVKVEFNFDRTVIEFNVREQTLILLTKMREIDRSIKVKSVQKNSSEWDDIKEIPEDDDFNDSFQTKEFLYRKSRKVVVHMKLVTSKHINQIKYSEHVKEFLFKQNVWLKTDRFDSKIESSPGLITMVHPKLINRDAYTQEVVATLAEAYSNITEKEQENLVESLGCEITAIQKVPTFYLEHSVKKWRELRAEVLRINCAKEDSEFLKYLFSLASEQNLLTRGEFLPEGLQLIENSQLVYDILQEHIEYLGRVTSIPLRGLTSSDFLTVVTEEKKTVREVLLGIEGVQSIEKARSRYFTDKWVKIIIKEKQSYILREFEERITVCYKHQKGQSKLVLAGPKKIVTPTLTGNRVHTYADILKKRYSKETTSLAKDHPNTARDIEDENVQEKNGGMNQEESTNLSSKKNPTRETTGTDSFQESENKLLQRIQEMEAKQLQMEIAQEQILLKQADTKKTELEDDKQAERNNTEEIINNVIEQKIASIKDEYTIQLAKTEELIKTKIDRTLNDKVNTISVQVGNQVALQLMEMFQGYMSTGNSTGIPPNLATSGVPFITQESPIVTTPQKQISVSP